MHESYRCKLLTPTSPLLFSHPPLHVKPRKAVKARAVRRQIRSFGTQKQPEGALAAVACLPRYIYIYTRLDSQCMLARDSYSTPGRVRVGKVWVSKVMTCWSSDSCCSCFSRTRRLASAWAAASVSAAASAARRLSACTPQSQVDTARQLTRPGHLISCRSTAWVESIAGVQ